MKIVDDVRAATDVFDGVVLTMGCFDGVHLGHRRILTELVRIAREIGGTAAVLTMRPHPREFFAPAHAPNLLTTDCKKIELLEEAGVDLVLFLSFTGEVAGLDREDFVEQVVRDRCHAVHVVAGHDYRFGKDGLGDYDFLSAVAEENGFAVTQVPAFLINGERVSSTLIRERLLEGDFEQVEAFLGRRYSVVGEVIGGRGIGVTLGFPTVNVRPRHTATPAQGVYAAEVLWDGRRYPAAVNIGIAPTIRHEDTTIEAHLLDFDENIRGRRIEIIFHKRLRPERKFPTHEELTAAIQHDVTTIRRYFRELGGGI
ncbi:MAG: bifunctional riboflavin kinase/FAD synthetase [Nitrospiraceae bacterium]|nr:bifunctional riboflavin kinase/FAD synthetase [Nitrospiraceae bacterium]